MRAIVLEKFGGLDSLVYKDIPEPEPKAGHVVIEIWSGQWRRPARPAVTAGCSARPPSARRPQNANAISTMSNFLARADRRRHFTSVSNGLPFSTM
jgi:hypothetical protein